MSRENVEYVRRGYEAANRRDVDAWVEGSAAEFEFHTSGNFPDQEPVYRGREAFRTFAE
jgi:ketosteroid isomerase-like protein